MDTKDGKRQSLCCICGKRLSAKTPEGEIRWQASHAGDKGLYCDHCYKPTEREKAKKKQQS